MYQYLVIEIINREPLKIGAVGSKENQTEPSKDYIPGSTIRGAMIGELIRKDQFTDKKREILTQMVCYNAYPYYDGHLYMPTPQHLRMDKHEWREKKSEDNAPMKLTNLLYDDPQKCKNTLEYSFVALKGRHMSGIKVVREYRLHHSTCRNHGPEERENLFRYQAIAAGQVFRTLIRVEQSLAERIKSVLEQTATFYLGGSKGSGYGLCKIRVIGELLSDYQKAKQLVGLHNTLDSQLTKQRYLIITCLSDCLCRNQYGQPINSIPEDCIKEICGQKVKLHQQFVQAGITEGYNTTWQARYPKESTLRAGSVLVYEFAQEQSGDALEKFINKLESQLIGYRVQDGFGWIGVNIQYPDTLITQADQPWVVVKTQNEHQLLQEIQQDEQSQQVMSIIVAGLHKAKERWLNMICIKSLDAPGQLDGGSFVIANELKGHHCRQMMELLEKPLGYLKSNCLPVDVPNANVLSHSYANDNRQCSIAGCNFKQIIRYLSSEKVDSQCDKLVDYAKNKLRSQKGLFYSQSKYREKQFVAELLYAGLYIQHRRQDR